MFKNESFLLLFAQPEHMRDGEMREAIANMGTAVQTQPQLLALLAKNIVPQIVASGEQGKAQYAMVSGLAKDLCGPLSARLVHLASPAALDLSLHFENFNVFRFGLTLAGRLVAAADAPAGADEFTRAANEGLVTAVGGSFAFLRLFLAVFMLNEYATDMWDCIIDTPEISLFSFKCGHLALALSCVSAFRDAS